MNRDQVEIAGRGGDAKSWDALIACAYRLIGLSFYSSRSQRGDTLGLNMGTPARLCLEIFDPDPAPSSRY